MNSPSTYDTFRFAPISAVVLAVVLTVSGCAVGPDYRRTDLPLPAHYPFEAALQAPGATSTELSPRWWEGYGDPVLTGLVDRALEYNADVRQAAARVEQADAVDRQASAARWPSINATGGATRSRSSDTTFPEGAGGTSNDFRLSGAATFELDFWGRLSRASEASRAQTLSTRYAHEVVRQTIASQVALGYFELLTLDQQIALGRNTLESRGQDLRLQRSRLDRGSSSRLDLEQAEGSQADAALQLHEYERQQALALTRLALLTGKPDLDVTARTGNLPASVPLPPAGLPSDLLERRPDVRQAEQLVAAANARIGVAEAARLPSLTLTGSGGGESADLSNLLRNPSRIWSLGIGLDLPLFDAGRRAAAVDQVRAERKEAQAAYQASAHTAFKDVSDALANLRAAQVSWAEAETRERTALNALAVARRRQTAGYTSFLELLDAQRTANSAQLQKLTVREAQLTASVGLYRALGGGWSDAQ